MTDVMSYRCASCGEVHEGLPELGFLWPEYYAALSAAERAARAVCNSDFCIIGHPETGTADRFIRCLLPIRLRGEPLKYGLGLWMSVSDASMKAYSDYGNGKLDAMPRVVGYIANDIPGIPSCLNIIAAAHAHSTSMRPELELKPCAHPLVHLWLNGVSRRDLEESLDGIIHVSDQQPDWSSAFKRLVQLRGQDLEWHFPFSPSTSVWTQCSVLDDALPVLVVAHDSDGEWQFLNRGPLEGELPVRSASAVVVDRDPTLQVVGDLPSNWIAWRNEVGGAWMRAKQPPDSE